MTFRRPTAQPPSRPPAAKLPCLFLLLLAGCTSMVLHPEREHRPNPLADRYDPQDVYVTTPDGVKLHGWILEPGTPARGTVVFFHGNAQNISTHVNAVLWLADAGYRVALVDYRGFGRSEGEADVAGAHTDALAFLDAMMERPEVDPERVVVLGQSFGGAVAIYAVAHSDHREPIRLLVVDSVFASYKELAREKSAGCCLTWPLQGIAARNFEELDRRFAPRRWISHVEPVPVLFLHGGRDPVIPEHHGRALYERAPEPKGWWLVEGGGHTRAFASSELRRELLGLLETKLAEE